MRVSEGGGHYIAGGGGANLSNQSPVVMVGNQPTMGRYNRGPGAAQVAAMSPEDQAAYHARALAYARARLQQLQSVASLLNPNLQTMLQQQQNPVDPAAAWRAISGAFAAQSRQAGYQDPRFYLRHVLPQILAAQQSHGPQL